MFNDMNIMDLIDAADGLLNNAYLDLVHVIRINDDLTNEIIDFALNEVIKNNSKINFPLKYQDQLIIYNKTELKNLISNVSISGSVKKPGSYEMKKNKSLRDLLITVGGFS